MANNIVATAKIALEHGPRITDWIHTWASHVDAKCQALVALQAHLAKADKPMLPFFKIGADNTTRVQLEDTDNELAATNTKAAVDLAANELVV